ncbi:cleavage and polyadenylation specificity factor subunit 3 [Lingula anatina]|uniref:Cleavage and polyadenylation specificity factor subunit 3 n=1 Tax=Lingula anatina TaxID=7574 RepID=A0A2R2MI55_LINAN|nr:cleavage and polyadenylation specificity factor subunit 3 [Lingula anatina]|eukprot:XP_023929900.1 cleavage and polyadenylation specificity factor subunit 3 [Lingula anatina]
MKRGFRFRSMTAKRRADFQVPAEESDQLVIKPLRKSREVKGTSKQDVKSTILFCNVLSILQSMDHFEDIGPSIVLASPGMMQSGLSRELFESWCTDKRNGVIIAGYCVEGTLAKHILSEPDEVITMSGNKLPLKCSVDYISFSAHTDYKQTSEFIRILKPPHIVLVHGEANEMGRLKAALMREYEYDTEYNIEVYNPRNTQTVELYFRGEKMAKVVGSLASSKPTQGQKISGILVKRNFNYHIMAPSDLHNYTELAMSVVTQRMSVPYTGSLPLLRYYLTQLSGDVEQVHSIDKPTLQVFKVINVVFEQRMVVLEWTASPLNDMYADSVLSVILRAERDPMPQKNVPTAVKVDKAHFKECVLEMLEEMFGRDCFSQIMKGDKMDVTVDGKVAAVNLDNLEVKCEEDDVLQQLLQTAITKLHEAISPVNKT